MSTDRPPAAGTEARGSTPTHFDWQRVVLLLALLIGAGRFLGLGAWSLWLDEAFTLTDSSSADGRDNPLGYYLLGRFYGLWSGRPGELLLRLPAALFGWASIPLAFLVFRPWVGRSAAAVASLAVAASSWHLYWSQNARFYTLALFIGLLGGGLYLRGVAQAASARMLAGLVALGLAALVHPSAALLLGGLVAAPWLARAAGCELRSGSRPWRFLALAGAILILFGSGWAYDVWWKWELKTGGGGGPRHFLLTTGYLLGPPLGLGFLAGCWRALRERELFPFALAAGAAAGLAAALLASLFVRVSAQYVFVLLPWIAAVAALPLRDPSGRLARPAWRWAYCALLVLPGLVDSGLYYFVRHGDRPRWREAYHYVFERRGPDDLVLGMDAPVGEYYVDPQARDLRAWKRITWLDRYRADQAGTWARYPRRTWLVVNREQLYDWSAEDRAGMVETLERDCELVRSFGVPLTPRDLDVHVYVRE